jgi:hypothetical protein
MNVHLVDSEVFCHSSPLSVCCTSPSCTLHENLVVILHEPFVRDARSARAAAHRSIIWLRCSASMISTSRFTNLPIISGMLFLAWSPSKVINLFFIHSNLPVSSSALSGASATARQGRGCSIAHRTLPWLCPRRSRHVYTPPAWQ